MISTDDFPLLSADSYKQNDNGDKTNEKEGKHHGLGCSLQCKNAMSV
jgi:hypothetical protein